MRLVSLFALSFLPVSLASAQTATTPATPPKTSDIVVLQASGQGCPVGFAARRAPDGGLVTVSPRTKLQGQQYSLTFSPDSAHAITQARITLHGLAGGRVIPAKDISLGDASESFNLSPSFSGSRHLFQSTIYTKKLTGVQWVELNELTYADGSTWHESDTATCRVAPNGFMLVAGK